MIKELNYCTNYLNVSAILFNKPNCIIRLSLDKNNKIYVYRVDETALIIICTLAQSLLIFEEPRE